VLAEGRRRRAVRFAGRPGARNAQPPGLEATERPSILRRRCGPGRSPEMSLQPPNIDFRKLDQYLRMLPSMVWSKVFPITAVGI
jgi:hypothetical protein